MPISRRPKFETQDDFIEAAKDDIKSTPKKISSKNDVGTGGKLISKTPSIQPLKLRIPDDLLGSIDDIVKCEKPKISRHTWILRALYRQAEIEKPN